ncbi:MAG: DUF4292 domain-containing protein [Bacteroidota bacterium]
MTPRSRYWLLLVFGLLILHGCRSARTLVPEAPPPADFPNHSADQILGALSLGLDSLQTYAAKASMAVKSPAQSGSFSATIAHRRADSLDLTISPGFGLVVARSLVTPDSFFVHDRFNKKFYLGPLNARTDVLPAPLRSGDVFAKMLGRLQPDRASYTVGVEDNLYVLRDSGTLMHTYWVDPALWRVVRFEHRLRSGMLLEQHVYSEFANFDGHIMPSRIEIELPEEDTSIRLTYRSLDLNPDRLAFRFTRPSNIETLVIR